MRLSNRFRFLYVPLAVAVLLAVLTRFELYAISKPLFYAAAIVGTLVILACVWPTNQSQVPPAAEWSLPLGKEYEVLAQFEHDSTRYAVIRPIGAKVQPFIVCLATLSMRVKDGRVIRAVAGFKNVD